MRESGDRPDDDGYEAVLAEFLGDRGRWPELAGVLERERTAEIEASYAELLAPTAAAGSSPPAQGFGSQDLSLS